MPLPNIVPPCPFCGRPTSIATIETHPTLAEIEVRTFCCDICGPVRTVAARGLKLPRAGLGSSGRFLEPSTRLRVSAALLDASRFPLSVKASRDNGSPACVCVSPGFFYSFSHCGSSSSDTLTVGFGLTRPNALGAESD
jgi:hypothetical protein